MTKGESGGLSPCFGPHRGRSILACAALFDSARHGQLLAHYAESTEHTITKLTRFHIEFEGIPPFIDGNGNGCTGRLLVNLELMKAGYPPIDIKFTDRLAYYNAFDAYHVKRNLSAM